MNPIYRRLAFSLVIILSLIALPTLAQDEMDPDDAARMDAIEEAVTDLRGLEATGPVAREVMSHADLEVWLRAKLDSEYPLEEARDDAIFYNALDFMPLDTDLWQLQLGLLAEQVYGFYDPEGRRMVVVADTFDPVAQLTYAHEFAHALQDQHFDLRGLGLAGDEPPDNFDLILARLALVEGDASQVMADYLVWRVQEQGDALFAVGLFGGLAGVNITQLASAPPIVNAELLFPYLEGQKFVQAALERGGWALVNAIYERPPLSTEQILHPDQYFNADEPQLVEISLPDAALGSGWRQVYHSALGEFYLREYLAQRLPDADAALAAEGWGGDSFAVYYNEATQGIVWVYRVDWDSVSHGVEFQEAFSAFAEARYGLGPIVEMEDGAVCWDGAARTPGETGEGEPEVLRYDSSCLLHSGADSLIVQGPDLNTVMAVQQSQPQFN